MSAAGILDHTEEVEILCFVLECVACEDPSDYTSMAAAMLSREIRHHTEAIKQLARALLGTEPSAGTSVPTPPPS